MSKIIARQLPDEQSDFSFFFEDDGLTAECGDEKYAVYIPPIDNKHRGFNADEYNPIVNKAKDFIIDIDDLVQSCSENLLSGECAELAAEVFPSLSVEKQKELIEWAKTADTSKPNDMAQYLSLTTGLEYGAKSFVGYSQGDWCEVIYCKDAYSEESINEIGKMWLGCGTEYCIDDCRGYFVTDDVQWAGGDTLVNKLAEIYGCEPAELQVEVIKAEHTRTEVEYECITEQEVKELEPISVQEACYTAKSAADDVNFIKAYFEQSSEGGKSAPTLSAGNNKTRVLAYIDCAIEDLQKLKAAVENGKIVEAAKAYKKEAPER